MSLPGVQVKMETSIESNGISAVTESSTDTLTSADKDVHASIKKAKKQICLTSVAILRMQRYELVREKTNFGAANAEISQFMQY
jgi:hypothetical protein